MAGDIGVRERVVLLPAGTDAPAMARAAAAIRAPQGRRIHQYGPRVMVIEARPDAEAELARAMGAAALTGQPEAIEASMVSGLDPIGRMGLEALALRQSSAYAVAKSNRPYPNVDWDKGDQPLVCTDQASGGQAMALPSGGPTSARLTGKVAVGIIIVEGPTAALKFSSEERTKVVAEVQNGLGWLATQSPAAQVSFHYDIQIVSLNVEPGSPDLGFGEKEALWRDPAMAQLGYGAGLAGVQQYIEDLRTNLGTDWTYCGFFTKYPVGHFAYASIGGPRLVMDYANDGWGPDNIDRVFAHETGHIFGAPDEYASSNCNCGGSWGFFGRPNGNCESCAPGGGVACIMRSNSWEMCEFTPWHLGFPTGEHLVVANFGYSAGGWRVDRHPRFLADLTGNGCADIVGFGDAGVWVARNNGDATFQAPQLVVGNFGYNAGGWRVHRHPRFLADLTGDGRADIVGFGTAGVWVARNNGDGTFQAPQLVVGNFGYNAGGWRVEQHPRFLADLTGDGRADIVGFGNAGVWVALNNGDGTFQAPQLVVGNFGYDAGGWRVERHPRFLADLTGDGRADIVGFGNAGVWVALNNGDGTFQAPQLVVGNFGYDAGGWRVEQHPRLLADVTGNGRADIVGFGNAGVWVARNNGDATFQAPQLVVNNFGHDAGGWRVDRHPRFLADLTGNGRADIVGFGDAGVWAARNNGDGTFQAPQPVVANLGYVAGGWRVDKHPRLLADLNGNGRADIVGFGDAGVWIALSPLQ